MSKYRNVLQNAPPLGYNRLNTHTQDDNKPEHNKLTNMPSAVTLLSGKSSNTTKMHRKKLSLDKVVLVYSRIHNACQLKFQTFTLAIQLFRKYMSCPDNPEEEQIPRSHLLLVCMYLSMKYSQIYPPKLKHVMQFIPTQAGMKLNLNEYMKCETAVFKKLGCSLNVKTAKTILDQLLLNSNQETYYYAYYLLEIAYHDNKITQEFTTEQICKAICYSMMPLSETHKKMKQFKGMAAEDVVYCSKLIISKKSKHTEQQSPIFMKYNRTKYMRVALQPFIQIKLEDL